LEGDEKMNYHIYPCSDLTCSGDVDLDVVFETGVASLSLVSSSDSFSIKWFWSYWCDKCFLLHWPEFEDGVLRMVPAVLYGKRHFFYLHENRAFSEPA